MSRPFGGGATKDASPSFHHVARGDRPRQRSRLVAAVALLAWAVVGWGCAEIPVGEECQRITWRVRVAERFLDDTADELVQLPARFEGRETWWVAPGTITVETRGAHPRGGLTERVSWILPDEEMVYSLDYRDARFEAVRLDRFEEERWRRARAAMVATVRLLGRNDSRDLERFRGNLAVDRGEGEWRIAAVPGHEWVVSDGGDRRIDWRSEPRMVAAFEDVSLEASLPIAEVLARIRPGRFSIQPLSSGHTGVRVGYTLDRVRRVHIDEARADLPPSIVTRARAREEKLADRELLWRLWDEPDDRPLDLDVRALRVRLVPLLTEADLVGITARLERVDDLEELEELLHLLFVIARSDFDKWYRAALEARDLPRVLAALSVRSLRAPSPELVAEILALEERRTDLFEGWSADQRRETETWLAGVRLWVSGRRIRSEAAEPDAHLSRRDSPPNDSH